MYQLLVLTSALEGDIEAINRQIEYLERYEIAVTLCIDPTEIELLCVTQSNYYDCAYIHIKRRTFSTNERWYDPVKLIEQRNIPLLGNSYITQMLIADKYTTSKKSGIGLPNHVINRSAFEQGVYDWEAIKEYPVIVKPNTLHASMGITEDSVVEKQDGLTSSVQRLFNEYFFLNEVLIEKFAKNGEEYTVSVLGNGDSRACPKNCVNDH